MKEMQKKRANHELILTKKGVFAFCICALCAVALGRGISAAVAENITNTCIDMKILTTIDGNGYDEIDGGLITDTGEILLYGWTTSTMWEKILYTNTFASCRDALVVMVSSDGAVQWLVTDGDANSQCMYSYVGAAIIDDHIVLCHRRLMDYTWEETYGITIMDYEGTILKKYEFGDTLVVRDTCDAGSSLLLCGYYIQNEYRIPFIYCITSSGELLWEYTDQPVSWLNGKYTENSFESVVGNDKGICIGVLDHGDKYVQLITLDSTGRQANEITMDSITMNEVWLSEKYYGIYGYTFDTFIVSYADAWGHQHKKIVERQSLGERITIRLECRSAMCFLVEGNMVPSGVFCVDQACRIWLSNPYPYPDIGYTGGMISDDNRVITLWGNTWNSSKQNKEGIIVTRGNIPMQ